MTADQKKHRRMVNSLIIFVGVSGILFSVVAYYTNYQTGGSVSKSSDAVLLNDLEAEKTPFLQAEEVVIVESTSSSTEDVILPIKKVLFEYVEVIDGCGAHFEGECLNVRSGPGTEYPVIAQLRNGIVLKVGGQVERDDVKWYKIIFDEWLRYPERVKGDWYVAAEFVEVLLDEGDKTTWDDGNATTTKQITIDRGDQKLYAFEGDDIIGGEENSFLDLETAKAAADEAFAKLM